ncbi:MAG: hypothetical protein R2744_00290 [Bacteroidales bacterium]
MQSFRLGDWGGIIINGNAPTNKGVDVESEIAGYPYGGNDAADNSGVLTYVRVEFGGAKIDPETEHNGFTFNGVGNGTTVDYIEAWNGTDDGIEMFGGTVNLKHVVSWNNTDDGFDWTYGWTGNVQHMVIRTGDQGDRVSRLITRVTTMPLPRFSRSCNCKCHNYFIWYPERRQRESAGC